MAMDKEKLVAGIVGGIVAGFSIGVGFMIAQKTMGRFLTKKAENEDTKVADAVKQGVTEGVKQAKVESDAANFAAMNAMSNNNKRGRSQGRNAMNHAMFGATRNTAFMGFDGEKSDFSGNPNKMNFDANPMGFSSPNSDLNNF
jgi:hypothetical protein